MRIFHIQNNGVDTILDGFKNYLVRYLMVNPPGLVPRNSKNTMAPHQTSEGGKSHFQ